MPERRPADLHNVPNPRPGPPVPAPGRPAPAAPWLALGKQQKRRSSVHGPGRDTRDSARRSRRAAVPAPATRIAPRGGMAGMALAFLAAFLLAPGAARAQSTECGSPADRGAITCADQAWTIGILHTMSDAATSLSLTVGGGTATTVTTGFSGILLEAGSTSAVGDLALTVGSAGAVAVVEGISGSNGIEMTQKGSGMATLDVRRGVTIGAEATPMGARGIYLVLNRDAANRGGGAASLTSGATIHAARQGLYVWRASTAQTSAATTITNIGAISAGVNNAASTRTGNLRPHGIVLNVTAPDDGSSAGDAKITNSGGITVSGGYDGIRMVYQAFGDAEVDNRAGGDIMATAPGGRGIAFLYSGGSGAATIKNAAVINAAGDNAGGSTEDEGGAIFMRRTDSSGGATSIENSGDVTATAANAISAYALSGSVSVTNRGNLSGAGSAGRGIRVWTEGDGDVTVTSTAGEIESAAAEGVYVLAQGDGAVSVTVSGGEIEAAQAGIHVQSEGTGDVTVTVGDGGTLISKHAAGIYAALGDAADNQVEITQGGTIMGRTGVYVEVAHGATAATPTARAASAQPLIDVTWTGAFSHGTTATVAPNDNGRFQAATAAEALAFDQESATVKAVEGTVRWGAPAGIEAHALSWRDVASEVAKGDDPGEIADADAQTALVPAGATASDNDYVAQFKAALGNEDLAVAAAVFEGIKTGATSLADVTDAEIVTYLRTDDDDTRTLLRNVLAQGLSEKEKAVLRAVATGDSAGLTTALDDADAGFSPAYKTAVRALLDRYNVGDIRIAVNGGSIGSIDSPARGDGIRAYYATPHANNGAISVTVAAGTTVTGAMAGIYVANAGLDAGEAGTDDDILKQTVTVNGMVTGGTDAAVHLVGGGTLTVGEMGKVHAGPSGRAILVNDPGRAVIRIDGEVRGGAGPEDDPAPAAVHLTGGGRVTVGPDGSVDANGAGKAIRGEGARTEVVVEVAASGTTATGRRYVAEDGTTLYREGVQDVADRVSGGIDGDGITGSDGGGVRLAVRDSEGMTGMGTDATLDPDGSLNVSGFTPSPCLEGEVRGADGECRAPAPPPDTGMPSALEFDCSSAPNPCLGIDIEESRNSGIRYSYVESSDSNGPIAVTVLEGTTVTSAGAEAGIYVANAGLGDVDRTRWGKLLYLRDDVMNLRQHFVTVHGTVTGGTGDAAVHLDGGGVLLVGRTGSLIASRGQPAVRVNDPGEAIIVIEGKVKGSAGAEAAVHLTGGGSVTVGTSGSVDANGAEWAILGEKPNDDTPATTVRLLVAADGMTEDGRRHVAEDGTTLYREGAQDAANRVSGGFGGTGITGSDGGG